MPHPVKRNLPPFLKWAGGKRWLLQSYPFLFPKKFNVYIEPFMGAASVFFALNPNRALLSDLNARLVECFEQMRTNSPAMWKLMLKHQKLHSDVYYYELRQKKFRSPLHRAAQFLYLNRTCWNGLYRVNLKGEFNVPKGTKSTVLFEGEDFSRYSELLSKTDIQCYDFEEALAKAGERDFVFVDPPYTVKHNYNGFKKYNENIFSWNDQIRLRDSIAATAERGATILVCNANHRDILDLYDGMGQLYAVKRKSVISGDASFRSETSEIILTVNYESQSIETHQDGAQLVPVQLEGR